MQKIQIVVEEPEQPVAKSFKCPICLKPFSKAGLLRHLYHIYGVSAKELEDERRKTAVVRPSTEYAAKLIELTKQLKELRAQKEQAKDLEHPGGFFGRRDNTFDELMRAYDAAERKILEDLSSMGLLVPAKNGAPTAS